MATTWDRPVCKLCCPETAHTPQFPEDIFMQFWRGMCQSPHHWLAILCVRGKTYVLQGLIRRKVALATCHMGGTSEASTKPVYP